jgi:hypothetical protein
MLQNAALDVAIALVVMYLTLSLLCTTINEFIATKLKLRARALAAALEQLLDHAPLRAAFYRHGLILSTRRATATGPQTTWNGVKAMAHAAWTTVVRDARAETVGAETPTAVGHPSYIPGRSVALALIGSLDPAKPVPALDDVRFAVAELPQSAIRDTLEACLIEAGSDLDRFRASVATWFDDSMERLSGAYKRQLKWISMLVGLLVAVVFNADSVGVAATLWQDQALRASMMAVATRMTESSAPTVASGVPADLRIALEKAEGDLRGLPIGWKCPRLERAREERASLGERLAAYWPCARDAAPTLRPTTILGWIMTAVALSLGAPFWFDLLQKFMNVRGAGARPRREDEKASA